MVGIDEYLCASLCGKARGIHNCLQLQRGQTRCCPLAIVNTSDYINDLSMIA